MAEILTTKGILDENTLKKVIGTHEDENELVNWQEWYLDEELVKRDVQLHLKQGVFAPGLIVE